MRLQSLTPEMVKGFETDLLVGGGRGGRALSAKAVRNVHGVLRRALQDAMGWDLVVRNPVAAIKAPQIPPSTVRAWTADDVGAFLDHTTADRLHPLWVFLATTGTRRGEALALRWSDVDLTAGRATYR